MKFRFITLVLCVIALSNCKKAHYTYNEGDAQGTTYHMTYQSDINYQPQIDSILHAFDKSLSAFDSTSIITRFNRNDTSARADKWFTEVFNKAREINTESNGMFDITVGPLIKAWGFYRKNNTVPDSAAILKILVNVGMNKVQLVNGRLIKQFPGTILDANAIAQGYSVDVICDFLQSKGINNYVVEIGGELKTKGHNEEGNKWRIGIDKPIDGNQVAGSDLQTVVEISGKAMATSGNYRRFIVENGVKYAHHVNPKTGYPSKNNLLSATVVANDCITADALGTSFLVNGLEWSQNYLKKHTELDAYLIYSNQKGEFQVFVTEGLKAKIRQ